MRKTFLFVLSIFLWSCEGISPIDVDVKLYYDIRCVQSTIVGPDLLASTNNYRAGNEGYFRLYTDTNRFRIETTVDSTLPGMNICDGEWYYGEISAVRSQLYEVDSIRRTPYKSLEQEPQPLEWINSSNEIIYIMITREVEDETYEYVFYVE